MTIEKASRLLKGGYMCDHCLGRQFAQLLKGMTNERRGRHIRDVMAMDADSGASQEISPENLYGYSFRAFKLPGKPKKSGCIICNNFFDRLDSYARKITVALRRYEFGGFLIGTKLSQRLALAEETLWEEHGTEWCEPLKAEINREVGKRVEALLKKRASFERPDITIVLDLEKNVIEVQPASVYVYGEYKKMKRGIPQTRWPCRQCKGAGCERCNNTGKMYRESVEEIVARPLLAASRADNTRFSGMGREDIDARCMDWRPFVLEMTKPLKRRISLRQAQATINKSRKVYVRRLRLSDKETARGLKAAKPDKTYRALVMLDKPIGRKELRILGRLAGAVVNQQTPTRVMHRRADLLRKKTVRSLSWRVLGTRRLELEIKAQAGLYIKELISGDNGRTSPSVSELIGTGAQVKELDVIKIDRLKL